MKEKKPHITAYTAFGKYLLLVIVLLCSFARPAQEETEEYTIKAAFIYKFTNYIDWDSLIPGADFKIGIIGSSPIKAQLSEIARTKTINSKKIVVQQFNKPEDIQTCHILFIPGQTPHKLNEILQRATAKGMLTISEKEGYAAKGTAINFVEIDNKLRFEANPRAISDGGLKASSQLLKLAIIVD